MPMQIEFKEIASKIGTGVSVVTFSVKGNNYGLTISSFTCVSVAPPTFLICVDKKHATNLLIQESGFFALHLLHEGQDDLSNLFAFGKPEERFSKHNWIAGETGSPVLADCMAYVECSIREVFEVETHSVIIGTVRHNYLNDAELMPLIYWKRDYRKLLN